MTIGEALIVFKSDAQASINAMKQVSNTAKNLNQESADSSTKSTKTIGDSFSGIMKTVTKFGSVFTGVIGIAGTAFSAFGLKTAADLESARQGFVNLTGSAEAADAIIARIQKEAAQTPFEVPGLTQAALLLTSVTKNGGEAIDTLLNVGKALAAAGKGQASLDNIITNLQQIGMTGKVTEMDIRQFGNNGVNILEILGDYYGTTAAKAGDMVKSSADAFGDLQKAFAKAGAAGGQFANAYIAQAGTLNQLISNTSDAFKTFFSDFVKQSGLFDAVKSGLVAFNNFMVRNRETLIAIGQVIGYVVTVAIGWINKLFAAIKASPFGKFFAQAFGEFSDKVKQFGKDSTDSSNEYISNNKRNVNSTKEMANQTTDKLKELDDAVKKSNENFATQMAEIVDTHKDKRKSLEKDIADENKTWKKNDKEKADDFSDKMKDIELRHKQKVASITKDLQKEKEASQQKQDDITSNTQDQLKQETEDYTQKTTDIKALIEAEKNKSYSANAQRLTDLQNKLATEETSYQGKVAKINAQSDEQLSKEKDNSAERLSDLQANLETENNEYTDSTAKAKAEEQQRTADALEEHTNRLTDLQTKLDEEKAFEIQHEAEIAEVKNVSRLDEIQKLQEAHKEELARIEEQRTKAVQSNDSVLKSTQDMAGGIATATTNLGDKLNDPVIQKKFSDAGKGLAKALFGSFASSVKENLTVEKIGNWGLGILTMLANKTIDYANSLPRDGVGGTGLAGNIGHVDYVPGSKYDGNAQGTNNWKGGLTWVGENGAELVNLPRGSQVLPHNKSMDMAQSLGGSTKNINLTIEAGNIIASDAELREFGRKILTTFDEIAQLKGI